MADRHSGRARRVLGRRGKTRVARRGEGGATLVEYALVLALVAVVSVGGLSFLGSSVRASMSKVAAQIADGCGGDGVFQILVDGQSCTADPWPLRATLGQGTTFYLTTTGGSPPVRYVSVCTNCAGDFDLVSGMGTLEVLPGAPAGPLPLLQVTATDSSGRTTANDLSILVAPRTLDSVVPIPVGAKCTYVGKSGSDYLGTCASTAWLDGYYIFTTNGWDLIVASSAVGDGEIGDTEALGAGTHQGGFTGVPDGPWTCAKPEPKGFCSELATNASGLLANPSDGALGGWG